MNNKTIVRASIGLLVFGFGGALFANNIGLVEWSNVLEDWWPLLIIAAGILVFINNVRSFITSAFLVLLGTLFLLREYNVISFEPWAVIWPLLLMIFGLSVAFRRSFVASKTSREDRDDISAIMAGVEVANHSQKFQASSATSVMGGAKLDLRKAKFADKSEIEIFAFWGGVEIIVPKNIIIQNRVSAIMGGVENKTQQKTDKSSPQLFVTGDVIMSGVSIRNTPSSGN